MNERIKELYRASKPREALASQDEFKSANSLLGSDVEKFARLIIEECANIANQQFSTATGLDDRDCWTANEIRKHFGVDQ